ncbi:hypothetical protein ACWGJ2_30235 [Streptomyces sp. NPDC054796]
MKLNIIVSDDAGAASSEGTARSGAQAQAPGAQAASAAAGATAGGAADAGAAPGGVGASGQPGQPGQPGQSVPAAGQAVDGGPPPSWLTDMVRQADAGQGVSQGQGNGALAPPTAAGTHLRAADAGAAPGGSG